MSGNITNPKAKAGRRLFPWLPALFLIFLTLRLAELGTVASWPWWAVGSPILFPLALTAIIVIVSGTVVMIVALVGSYKKKGARR